ncbi:sigmaY antisigma factor component [Bacillus sinesaloumensis]|uniref:sigmaY antisigma factor component n=1 Tax=Litchfieldia sinesaloumensis TaxID=1926280 RepID=UPI00098894DD|nr:sigmaY antisigma factor component [Bacillus sinesaloumensis]
MTTEDIRIIIPVVILVLIQGFWLFLDARKRGHNYWFWGIWGLIQTPLPTIFYLIFARKIYRRKAGRE